MIARCRQRADFEALKRGRRVGGRVLWVLAALDDDLGEARVAFAIGRAQGSAVERNRLRRRIQAVLRSHAGEVSPGRYLFGARRPARSISFEQIEEDVLHLVDRVQVAS